MCGTNMRSLNMRSLWSQVVLCVGLFAASASADPISAAWTTATTDAIVANKIDTNTATRLLASVHVAQYQAVQQTLQVKGLTHGELKDDPSKAEPILPSLHAAFASAGKTVLLELVPASNVSVNALYDTQLKDIIFNPEAFKDDLDRGVNAATAILTERATDGSSPAPPPFLGKPDEVGKWRPTPPENKPALTPQWKDLKPWALEIPSQFRLPPPPVLDSDVYKQSYLEVKSIGNKTSIDRTQDQTDAALFWSGNVEVYLSQLVNEITDKLDLVESSRYHAIASVAMADARIAAWDSKFEYLAWRPVTAIPVGNGQNNEKFPADPAWETLFKTPNHPEYPQGHSTTGQAVVEVLKALVGKDEGNYTLSSYTLPNKPRTYASLSDINTENANSRTWGGVHYRHSAPVSKTLGAQVAKQVLDTFDAKYGPTATSTTAPPAAPSQKTSFRVAPSP